VPGTKFRFGWDAILGLIPGGGDLLTGVMGAALIFHAHRTRVPKVVQLRMLMNVGLDIAIGLLPLVGDAVDVFWKSNTRNMALLERYAGGVTRPSSGDWLFVAGVLVALVLMASIPIIAAAWMLSALFERGLF
jgi:hypothetical protein